MFSTKRYLMGTRSDGTSDVLIEDSYDVLSKINQSP